MRLFRTISTVLVTLTILALFQNCGGDYEANDDNILVPLVEVPEIGLSAEFSSSAVSGNLCNHDINIVINEANRLRREVAQHHAALVRANYQRAGYFLRNAMTSRCNLGPGDYDFVDCKRNLASDYYTGQVYIHGSRGIRPIWNDLFQFSYKASTLAANNDHIRAIRACAPANTPQQSSPSTSGSGGSQGALAGISGQYALNENGVVLQKASDTRACKVSQPNGVKRVSTDQSHEANYRKLKDAWDGVRGC